jgi:hypothetical protein
VLLRKSHRECFSLPVGLKVSLIFRKCKNVVWALRNFEKQYLSLSVVLKVSLIFRKT